MDLSVVPQEVLERVAALAPKHEKPMPTRTASTPADGNVVERARKYLSKVPGAVAGQGGHNQTFHAASVLVMGFGLDPDEAFPLLEEWNQTCDPPWAESDLRRKLTEVLRTATGVRGELLYRRDDDPQKQTAQSERTVSSHRKFEGTLKADFDSIRPVTIGSLIDDHPQRNAPVIDGLLRRGETANIIAPPKRGKSWLVYDLLLSVIMGRRWLTRFPCTPGRVLLIDNELHPSTLAHRLPVVADALGLSRSDYEDHLDVLTLRGQGIDLVTLGPVLERLERGAYALAVGDAWYRFLPTGISENDNAAVMSLYNLIDQYAAKLGCAWVNIHHASKGMQGDKAVTDVGAGAGSQSRAADTHIVLRQHEDESTVVLEAAVRSFAPVEPIGLTWEFPLWRPDVEVDTSRLRGRLTKAEERQTDRDAEGKRQIVEALMDGPATVRELRRRTGGMGKGRVERLVDALEAEGSIASAETTVRGNPCREYSIKRAPQGDVVWEDRTTSRTSVPGA